jgi:CMP-N,N'-diacetyllegionaminic acid synthase|tara:strand:- start:3326 stop:4003 length:678 start_codon:yes stop_codon:yes gene_type:complete
MRSGSRGLKNKHLKKIKNKPLIFYTIDYIKSLNFFKYIAVSSDSKIILSECKKLGLIDLVKRPKNLSTSFSPKIPVIKHVMLEMEKKYNIKFDYIVDFDATSPIRKKNDFKKAINYFIKTKADLLITGTKSRKNPYFNMIEEKNGKIQLVKKGNFIRRQDAPKVYDMNASFYIFKRNFLLNLKKLISKKTVFFEMSEISAFDIDNLIDFKINETLIKNDKKIYRN